MDITLSPEDLQFRDEVREFLTDNAYKPGTDYMKWRLDWFKTAEREGRLGRAQVADRVRRPRLDAHAALHLGAGNGQYAACRWDMPFGVGMLAPILMGYGTKEQQERFLPDIRARNVNWCQGYSEPGAGSDLASLKTKAVLQDDGSHYTVNGTKSGPPWRTWPTGSSA